MAQSQNIIEKVQKLISLKDGAEAIGSLAEAANAAEKVQKLLLKHNLEMMDVTNHVSKEKSDILRSHEKGVYAKKNEGQWIYQLYSSLAKHNLCTIILSGFWDEKHRKKNQYVNLIGTQDNTITVKFLAEQLEARLRVMVNIAYKAEGKHYEKNRNAFKRAYFMGAVSGIDMQLQRAKEEAMRNDDMVTTLVVSNKGKLQDYLENEIPNLRAGRRSKGPGSQAGRHMGYNDGRSMSINKGVSGSSSSSAAIG